MQEKQNKYHLYWIKTTLRDVLWNRPSAASTMQDDPLPLLCLAHDEMSRVERVYRALIEARLNDTSCWVRQ